MLRDLKNVIFIQIRDTNIPILDIYSEHHQIYAVMLSKVKLAPIVPDTKLPPQPTPILSTNFNVILNNHLGGTSCMASRCPQKFNTNHNNSGKDKVECISIIGIVNGFGKFQYFSHSCRKEGIESSFIEISFSDRRGLVPNKKWSILLKYRLVWKEFQSCEDIMKIHNETMFIITSLYNIFNKPLGESSSLPSKHGNVFHGRQNLNCHREILNVCDQTIHE
ncbi:hypothetical protein ACTFIW_003773 [Dictyostelium discoideum]